MTEPRTTPRCTVRPDATTATTTHLLYDGDGGWIEAKRAWLTFPHREVDNAPEDCWGWQFKTAADLIRWLDAPGDAQ